MLLHSWVVCVDVVAEIGVGSTSDEGEVGGTIGELGIGFAVVVEGHDIDVLEVAVGVHFVQ